MILGWIDTRRVAGAYVVALFGEHDLSTRPMIRRKLDAATGAAPRVVVDLRHVEFVDSAVVNCLIDAHRRAADRCCELSVVVQPWGRIERLLELVGFPRLVPMHRTIDESMKELPLR
jgi:anti-anti-sigma factor